MDSSSSGIFCYRQNKTKQNNASQDLAVSCGFFYCAFTVCVTTNKASDGMSVLGNDCWGFVCCLFFYILSCMCIDICTYMCVYLRCIYICIYISIFANSSKIASSSSHLVLLLWESLTPMGCVDSFQPPFPSTAIDLHLRERQSGGFVHFGTQL